MLLSILVALAALPAASGAITFKRLDAIPGGAGPDAAFVRTADGTLHLVYETTASRNGADGLATIPISPAGKPGATVQALSGTQTTLPGLLRMPNGDLESVFGANDSIFGITSSDGGVTWSGPVDVKSGPNESLAYASPITAQLSGTTPVLTVPQAGNLVIQQGFGPTSPTFQLNSTSNGALGNVDSAVDAASGEVVASWQSNAGQPTLYMQGASPTVGAAQAVPGQASALVLAGRDVGPGVFAGYTTDGKHVRLIRYGGGSVAVGSRKGITAKAIGVATGLQGRIWVMWGTDSLPGGVALTRSNKAVTRFEPIQRVQPKAGSLYRLSGDGRLGPLDLLVDQIPDVKGPIQAPGNFYARVLPVMSVSASVKKGKSSFTVTVTVTDAGDPVAGASVSGTKSKTNSKGIVTFSAPLSSPKHVTLTVTATGYQTAKKQITF